MTQGVDEGFAEGFLGYLKVLIPIEAHYFPALGEVLEEERHTSVQEFEEVSFGLHVVVEGVFVVTGKSCHTYLELRVFVVIGAE